MSDNLTIRQSVFVRIALATTGVLRAVGLMPPLPTSHNAGSDFIEGQAASPQYSPDWALSAYPAFSWVFAAVNAVATDMSGLELRAYRGTGKDRERVEDHPVLTLLKTPHNRARSGVLLRRLVQTDLELFGNAYVKILSTVPSLGPTSLIHLNARRVKPVPGTDGIPESYDWNVGHGQTENLHWTAVLHFRTAGVTDGPGQVYGQGVVQPLHEDLTSDKAAQTRTRQETARGRPAATFSPEGEEFFTPEQTADIKDALDKSFNKNHGGVAILGLPGKLQTLGWSPAEIGAADTRVSTREAVLAVVGVPPTRVQLPNANYATAQAERETYWEILEGKAPLQDSEWTRLGQMFPGFEDVEIEHYFGSVQALTYGRSEALNRVQQWWLMGVPLADAVDAEGFEEIKITEADLSEPAPAPAEDTTSIAAWFDPQRKSAERGIQWRGFIDGLHTPVERLLTVATQKYLKAQAVRLARAAGKVLGKAVTSDLRPAGDDGWRVRQVSAADLDRIFDDAAEAGSLRRALGSKLADALLRAFRLAVAEIGDFDTATATVTEAAEALIADMVSRVTAGTKETLRQIISQALSDGLSVHDMQQAIAAAKAFTPMRALRIARTETTRALSAGSLEAVRQANEAGVSAQVEWLSAQDSAVRASHRALDGQVQDVGDEFTSPVTDAKALHPGGFGIASEDVNCRCTLIPRLEN